MTKYVIMDRDKEEKMLPVIHSDYSRCIREWQKAGYRIIGRIKIDDDFMPVNVVIKKEVKENADFNRKL